MSSFADGRPAAQPLAIVALISGRGSNLQAIIDAIQHGDVPAVVRAVISNRPGAEGLERARRAGIATEVVPDDAYAGRREYDAALSAAIERHGPDLIALAGFMRILGRDFVRRYDGRLLNIHPSLLPEFTGLDTHRRALEAGAAEHGASVHFVTEAVDGGPVIVQARTHVRADDTPAVLAARVLQLEHRVYPLAIRWFAEGRVRKRDGVVVFDGRPLTRPLEFSE